MFEHFKMAAFKKNLTAECLQALSVYIKEQINISILHLKYGVIEHPNK